MRDLPPGLETSWKFRRRAVWITIAFCKIGLVYLMVWGRHDSRLHETIAGSLALLLGSVVMAYIAGATYDDRSKRQALVSYRAAELRGSGKVDDPG